MSVFPLSGLLSLSQHLLMLHEPFALFFMVGNGSEWGFRAPGASGLG